MAGSLRLQLDVTVRDARSEDLRPLEWYGMLTPHREAIERAWRRAAAGEIAFLVAEANGFPVGQVWVDLVSRRGEGVGVVWSFRVIPNLQNLGVGSRMMSAAEARLAGARLRTAELAVAKDNRAAHRLYVRLGYRVTGERLDRWQLTTPEGCVDEVEEDTWVMRKPLAAARGA